MIICGLHHQASTPSAICRWKESLDRAIQLASSLFAVIVNLQKGKTQPSLYMEGIDHQRIKANGIWLHVAQKGTGQLVLLLHGFPDFWYSWRHQITYLADRGYHVVAPDLRGYGDSDSPANPSSYTLLHIVGDIVALLDHFGQHQVSPAVRPLLNRMYVVTYLYRILLRIAVVLILVGLREKAFVLGHDWGALAGWYLSLLRPDRVKGLVALSVPFYNRNPEARFTEIFDRVFGDGFYICQFQEPGRAEQAFARYDCMTLMKKFLLLNRTDNMVAPPGIDIIDDLETPAVLPAWITQEELEVYADKFQQSGFTGPLNYYRAMDLNWEISAPWQGSKVTVPAKFIVGNQDIGFETSGTKQYIEGGVFRSFVPDLEVVVLNGHHFIHQEKAQEVSEEIAAFLHKHSSNDENRE
ncbi:unnamed protein product [Linum tenue]|uniref:AB hydrolase-1 domain-containing protein n=1 Tax=Linum tenue TaxID=586396 RepID=A0AAV0I4E9_9ROSI|nr:unnamed protein product [Linum tenue]